jgi:hypothetical protein
MSMMAVIAISPIDLKTRRARLSQSEAKGNRLAPNIATSPVGHTPRPDRKNLPANVYFVVSVMD